MARVGHHAKAWLVDRYTEHPPTYGRHVDLVNALAYDGDLDAAHELADRLVKCGAARRDDTAYFYMALGARSVLAGAICERDSRRNQRRSRTRTRRRTP